jgi:hypothetical protein
LIDNNEAESQGSISNVHILVDGVPILNLRYWGESVEPNLVTGFVSAIASFAREVTNDGLLKTVNFPTLKIVSLQIMEQPQVIISITVREGFPIRVIEVVLQAIARVFLEEYSQDITGLRGTDLTSEFGSRVHDAIVSSPKEIRSSMENKSLSNLTENRLPHSRSDDLQEHLEY